MPEPVDPFTALERPVEPIAPSRAFTAELRGRIERALGRTHAPAGASTLTPYLAVRDSRAATRFYEEVFGARLAGEPIVMDDGRIGHSELRIGDAVLFMADEFPEIGVVSPEAQEGSSVSFVIHVPDVDAAFARAVARGAVVEREVEDGQHGSRAGWLRDPFGHRWNVGTPQDMPSRPLRTDTVDLGLRAPLAPAPEPEPEPIQLGYYTLGSADAATTRAFFSSLFAWRFDGDPAQGGHIGGSNPPGGVEPDGAPSTIYFRVTDIESFADRVSDLGGTASAVEAHPSGRNATCEDPTGVRFVLWEPAEGY